VIGRTVWQVRSPIAVLVLTVAYPLQQHEYWRPFALRIATRPVLCRNGSYHEPRCSGTRATRGKAATSNRAAMT